jgi:hypothetical protein
MPHILSLPERDRLIAILSRLHSNYEGERQAAALAAVRFLKARDLQWQQVIAPPASTDSWKDTATACLQLPAKLSAWEISFLRNLLRLNHLSAKQRACLVRIADRVLRRAAA